MITVGSINYFVDSHGLYARGGEKQKKFFIEYAQKLQESPQGLVAHENERHVKRALAQNTFVDCYLLGSSHIMSFDKEALPQTFASCNRLVNLGVSGAGLEDIITFLYLSSSKPSTKQIFIAIDPWTLKLNMDKRYTLIHDTYQMAKENLRLQSYSPYTESQESGQFARWMHIINCEYFLRNLYKIYLHKFDFSFMENKIIQVSEKDIDITATSFDKNGRFYYSQQYLAKMPPQKHEIGDGGYKISKPYIEEAAIQPVLDLIKRLKQDKKITFIMTPYHPQIWECHNEIACQAMTKVEAYIKDWAKVEGIKVVGSYKQEHMRHEDFLDDMHVAPQALKKIEE